MHCYEHEMLCRVLEARIRALDPSASIDRLDVSDALTERGIHSLQMLGSAELTVLAERFVPMPLAA